jgi:hypothetical protein
MPSSRQQLEEEPMNATAARSRRRPWLTAATLGMSLALAACIVKDTRSTMYLSPDGSVTWTILQANVFSDAKQASERDAEEQAWRNRAAAAQTPLTVFLESLGGWAVSRTVLKDTAPFEVHTTARFDRIDTLFGAICCSTGSDCVSQMQTDGNQTTLTVWVAGQEETSHESSAGDTDPVVDALGDLKIVLTSGRFVKASGFVLDGTRAAHLDEKATDGAGTLSLTWEKDTR